MANTFKMYIEFMFGSAISFFKDGQDRVRFMTIKNILNANCICTICACNDFLHENRYT